MEGIVISAFVSIVVCAIGILIYSKYNDGADPEHVLVKKLVMTESELAQARSLNYDLTTQLARMSTDMKDLRREVEDMRRKLQLANEQIATLSVTLAGKLNSL